MRRFLPLLVLAACGTLGTEHAADPDLPSSGVGPFRKLSTDEVLGVAPYVLRGPESQTRDPGVVPLDADPASARVALYAVATTGGESPQQVIVRTRADDGRSFYGDDTSLGSSGAPAVVLAADAAWEGGYVASPSPLRVGQRLYLYYAAKGGVGLAVSDDGFAFVKQGAPVLAADPASTWETSAPAAPSVAVFPDGTWHMLYAAGDSLGEATSPDGIAWTRAGADPVLGPGPGVDPSTLLPGEKPPFDTARVADPVLAPRLTPAGRLQVRVLYTGFDDAGASTIGFAARYEATGPLTRQPSPVYSVGKHERAPALFEWAGGALLYVQQDYGAGTAASPVYPAIAAAYAPAERALAVPTAYADGP